MNLQTLVCAGQQIVQLPGVFQGVDLLDDAHPYHILGIAGGGVAQNQNGKIHVAPAKLNGLLHVGDRQILGAQLLQMAAHRHRAMTVGVGLHHPQKPAGGRNRAAQHLVVVG